MATTNQQQLSTSSPSPTASISLTPTLFYHATALPAANYYTTLLPSSRINRITHYPALFPTSEPMSISITLLSNDPNPLHLLLLNLPPPTSENTPTFPWSFNESFSLTLLCDTQAEIDAYYDTMVADGGKAKECCWVEDKFGVSWQIVPRLLVETIEGEDRQKAARAYRCMLGWGKADLGALEDAITGGGQGEGEGAEDGREGV